MRIVGAGEEFVVADELHHQRKHLLLRVAVDPDVARQIFRGRPLHLRGVRHVLEAIIQPLHPFAHPAGHRLDGRHAQFGKPLEHSVVHHRRQRLARVLNDVHGHVHQAGVDAFVILAAGIVAVHDQVQADAQVQTLGRSPRRVQIGMAQAAACALRVHDRRRGHEDGAAAQLGDALHLAHRQPRVAQRDVRRGDEPVEPAGARLERPGVVGAAQRVGQIRVGHRPLPEQPQRRIDDLMGKALVVQKRDALAHVLPVVAVGQIAVERGQVLAGFLLAVADQRGQHLFHVDELHGLAVHEDLLAAVRGVVADAHRPLPKLRIDEPLEQVQRFDEMGVPIDELHGGSSVVSRSDRGDERRYRNRRGEAVSRDFVCEGGFRSENCRG